MSEEGTTTDKPESKPLGKTEPAKPTTTDTDPSDTFTIDIKGLDSADSELKDSVKAYQKQSNEALTSMAAELNKLKKDLSKADKKADDSQKQVWLDKLKQANLDPEGFKNLDSAALKTVVEAMAKTNPQIIVPKSKGNDDPSKSGSTLFKWDPKKRKRVPFYSES